MILLLWETNNKTEKDVRKVLPTEEELAMAMDEDSSQEK